MNIYEDVTSKRFKQIMNLQNHVLIDLRTPQETAKGKIAEDALELDVYAPDFLPQLQNLDKTKRYLIYCRSGGRSAHVLNIMKQEGFKEVYNLANGILDYTKHD